ncbi:MAG TPA: ABC transporter ATP-binding protein [Patescibacteria group bacterium]
MKKPTPVNNFHQLLKNIRRVNAIIWPDHKRWIIMLFVIYGVISATPFLQSGSVGWLVNQLFAAIGQSIFNPSLTLAMIVLVLASTLPIFLLTYANYLEKMLYLKMEEIFELLIARRRGEIDVASHEDPKKQDLFSKVDEDGVWRLQNFADRQLFIFQNIVEVIIASVVIVLSEPWIFVLLFLCTIPELVVEARYGNDLWGMYGAKAETRRRFWDLRQHFQRVPTLIELKVGQNTNRFVAMMGELFASFQSEQRKQERHKLIQQTFSHFIAQIAIAVALVWFVYEVLQGSMQVGTLTFVLASIAELRRSFSSLFTNLGKQYQDSLFVTDIFAVVDMPPTLSAPENPIAVGAHTPEVVFENVAFAYPGTDRLVLKNVSFTIKAGEKIGLIGINGAGKTTLVKLLCRFYDPTSGRILIDGHDLKDLSPEEWYKRVGVIFQEYAHYNFPVKEAIAIGDSGRPFSLQQVKDSAKRAGADSFITEWKDGYNQMLGKQFTDGVEPSIGQWQKLALARMFYRNPNIVVLDEPTSSIDAEAESQIFEQLERLPEDRTVILITHRFATVRNVDKIVVLKDGTISEMGSHKELVVNNKDYARLFYLQAKGYSSD